MNIYIIKRIAILFKEWLIMNSNLILKIILIAFGIFSFTKSMYHFYRTYKQSRFYKGKEER